MEPKIKISGVFEVLYIGKPKENKPVYVQVVPQGQKYPAYTFAFDQKVCPVTQSGQVFGADMDCQYQVYIDATKVKPPSHSFLVLAATNVKRYTVKLVDVA